ncbi:MAG: DUF1080 domain-containing protein [Verrucomicrobiae bacterium]|nr:DUF1080 domain-containing protein [Verrucomicrobiae bacterium]MCP5539836.1 DUF1080 domain-containing protein [Akkermansiaceae bacterium]
MKTAASPAPTLLVATLAFAASAAGLRAQEFENLDRFVEPAGWSLAKTVEGDPNEKKWSRVEPGAGTLINGEAGKAGNLTTKEAFGDVEVDVEFMVPKGSNSGIYFQGCYEVQIFDSFGKADGEMGVHDCGAIYERWDEKREPKGYEGTIPKTNASRAPGEWQTFRIVFRAPRFDAQGKKTENARFVKVEHNGKTIHENVALTGPTRGGDAKEVAAGPFRIQGDHGPVAFRKFAVKPVKLD